MNRYDARDRCFAELEIEHLEAMRRKTFMDAVTGLKNNPPKGLINYGSLIADQQTYTNIGKAYAPEPPPKIADKPIHEMTLLDYQKAFAAYDARQGKA